MKREKFLEKISQDERVEKIEYKKGWGYSLHLKNGFGEIIKSSSTMHFGHNYNDFTCLKIFNWLRASSQAEIEIFLDKVEKIDEKEIEKTNKKYQLQALERFSENTKSQIQEKEIEISRINARKNNLEELKIKIDEKIKEINNELSNKN